MNIQVKELQSFLEHSKIVNTNISKRGIDWHIDHCCRVIIMTCKSLINSNPKEYKKTFNWKRSLAFIFKKFPRGIAKAPKIVNNKETIKQEDLESILAKTNEYLSQIIDLSPDSYLNHPYFGHIKLKKTKEFLEIHTEHHLKIMREILL